MQLYKISFTTTNKVYIGISSVCAKRRLSAHIHENKGSLISKAIKKHGAPILTIIGECDDWELLCLAEQEAISKFNSITPHGYNLTQGGEGSIGITQSNETRLKRSNALKGRIKSEDEKLKLSIANKGKKPSALCFEMRRIKQKPMSIETKNKLSAISKKNFTEEMKAKLISANTGRLCSEKTKLKISAAHRGKTMHPKTKEILLLKNTGSTHSEEHKNKISMSMKEYRKTLLLK